METFLAFSASGGIIAQSKQTAPSIQHGFQNPERETHRETQINTGERERREERGERREERGEINRDERERKRRKRQSILRKKSIVNPRKIGLKAESIGRNGK